MGAFAAGQKSVGTLRPVTTTAEIEFGRMYAIEGYVHPLSNLSDSLLQRAVNALVAFDSPIDVTFAEIASDGHVTIQGKATHNSPVLLIASALVLLLAGIGIALSVSHIYSITDAVVAGGRLPGGAPGDKGSEGVAPASVFDLVPLLAIAAGVFLFIRYR
jgi:hypothetical protein